MTPEKVVKKISGLRVVFGGETHEGWLPKDAVPPPPTPQIKLRLELEIREVEGGFLLEWWPSEEVQGQRAEAPFVGDLWFDSIEGAEEAATDNFGVLRVDWEATS